MNFYETGMGSQFFCQQLPELIKALQDIAVALSRPTTPVKLPMEVKADFLSDLYWGNYEPSVFQRNEETPKLDAAVMGARTALTEMLPAAVQDCFETYQAAVDSRTSAVVRQAYESGYRTAVQMILAGLAMPEEEQDREKEEP